MNDYDVNDKQLEVTKIVSTITQKFNLPLNKIIFIQGDAMYGLCTHDGIIYLKLKYHDDELVPEMEVWRTVAHELAHLKFFNHDHDFWVFNKEILAKISELLGRRIRPEVAFTRKGVIY